jgi:hypothetical protein
MASPSYKDNDPKGWCGDPRRGAAMGRNGIIGPADFAGRLCLQRVRMSACGAYDSNGTYFGHGNPIYWYASDCGEVDGTLRAAPAYDSKISRADARRQILELYPNAKIRK